MFPKIKQLAKKIEERSTRPSRIGPADNWSPDPVEQKEIDRKIKKTAKKEKLGPDKPVGAGIDNVTGRIPSKELVRDPFGKSTPVEDDGPDIVDAEIVTPNSGPSTYRKRSRS